jgi:hypothetical protein
MINVLVTTSPRLVVITATIIFALFDTNAAVAARHPMRGRISEIFLRSIATTVAVPLYPESAIRKNASGVAVADVVVNEDGRAGGVTILEAPDPAIAASLRDALYSWTFQAHFSAGETSILPTGKITYYFVLSDGKGAVYPPSSAPYIGRWRKASQTIEHGLLGRS